MHNKPQYYNIIWFRPDELYKMLYKNVFPVIKGNRCAVLLCHHISVTLHARLRHQSATCLIFWIVHIMCIIKNVKLAIFHLIIEIETTATLSHYSITKKKVVGLLNNWLVTNTAWSRGFSDNLLDEEYCKINDESSKRKRKSVQSGKVHLAKSLWKQMGGGEHSGF